MRVLSWLVVSVLIGLPVPASADRIQPGEIEYLGYFLPPPNQGSGNENTWSWGTHGLTLIPDCLGQPDPSPNDGYPGCMGAFGHVNAEQFGVFDLVPPGGQAQQVVPFYELGAPVVEQQIGYGGTKQYYDVLYDNDGTSCRLWFTYGDNYTEIAGDPPFLGMSDCTPGNPNPQGLWDFGTEDPYGDIQLDPFHSAKMYQGLSLIPDPIANQYFDGNQMMLGISRRSGTHGGSQGPSLYVRPLEPPLESAPGPVMDAKPLVWYQLTGFMEWWDEPQMDGPVVHWWTRAKAYSAEFVRAGSKEAVILPWREPIINPNDYPCADPFAYRDQDPTTPNPCEVPVCWYGVASCRTGPPDFQQPSFWDDSSTGAQQPIDCNVADTCGESTGMHCLSIRPYLIFYDIQDLTAVYQNQQSHNFPQPYAKIPLDAIWINGTGCGSETKGSTYDFARQLLYISEGVTPPVIHVFSIGGDVQNFTLSVDTSGQGSGRIGSTPAGIDCGSDCDELYPNQTVVQLSAVPDPGSAFVGWWGPADCADGTVTVSSNMTCTATFALESGNQHLLSVAKDGTGNGTVTSSPVGISCGDDCGEYYDDQTVVQLNAVPDSGSQFAGWGGDSDCSDGQVGMEEDLSCVAQFNLEPDVCAGTEVVTVDDWSTAPYTQYSADYLALGELAYTDRNYQILGTDPKLVGASLIQTANNDKQVTTAQHLFLTLCSPAQVFVAYDSRANSLPTWLGQPQWELTSSTLETSDPWGGSPMRLYRASLPAGQLILGGNQEGGPNGAESNYVVIVASESSIFNDGVENGDTSRWTVVCDESTTGDPRCSESEF